MPKWKKAIVREIKLITPHTKSFLLDANKEDAQEFIPGQFITFDLPIAEKRLDRWRSYSIASAPNENGLIELCIVEFEKGKGSSYLFTLEEGAELEYKGPSGVFTLSKDLADKKLTFICTGTGVAPFKSMIEQLDSADVFPNIDLIFGTRKAEDILYQDYFQEVEKRYEQFTYHVALSREHYKGYQGYVHDIYERLCKEDSESERIYYLCGWQEMIDEAVLRLKKMGVTENRIVYELYG